MKYDKVSDYIHVENVIPQDVCIQVLDRIRDADWSKHSWRNNATNEVVYESENELDVLHSPPDLDKLLIGFVGQAATAYKARYAYRENAKTRQILSRISNIRFNRYPPGNIMRMHHDHIHSLFDGNERGIPVLSFVGILNSDYQGGDLVFFGDYRVSLKAGDIVMFPSNFVYPHQVDEITSGIRYYFVSWAW